MSAQASNRTTPNVHDASSQLFVGSLIARKAAERANTPLTARSPEREPVALPSGDLTQNYEAAVAAYLYKAWRAAGANADVFAAAFDGTGGDLRGRRHGTAARVDGTAWGLAKPGEVLARYVACSATTQRYVVDFMAADGDEKAVLFDRGRIPERTEAHFDAAKQVISGLELNGLPLSPRIDSPADIADARIRGF
jgi:hypothetical protein